MASGLSLNIDTTKSEFQNPMIELRQGDGNYQSLRVTVTSNGEPLMLDGWTISFMGTTAGGHKIVDSDTHVINASNGVFDYTPTKAWGQDIGEFDKAYFKFTNGDEAASGANFRVKVFEAVDLTDEEAGDYISVVDVMIDKIKTDMDNKLADTQTTLTNTQNQAKTVQSNVNYLNTNVNELKAQNNNIKTSDNTWSGTNTFNKRIIAPAGVQGNADSANDLNTRPATFTDFATVATDMNTYAGQWRVSGTPVTNSPVIGMTYYIVEVISDPSGTTGIIRVGRYGNSDYYYSTVNGGKLNGWHKIAQDETVVHNIGNETVAGDKTFMGNTTFINKINGSFMTRPATFTDFATVATDMNTYAGQWRVSGTPVTNSPVIGMTYYIVEVISDPSGTTGIIRVGRYGNSDYYYSTVNGGKLNGWHKIAQDETVVHNIGDESIGGNKSITGSLTINDANPLKVKQSATIEFNSWQASKMKATRFGNVVALRYSVNPNNNNTITKNQTSPVVIPQGYRPMEQWNMAVGGVSAGSNVLVNQDGTLTSGWQDVQYAGMMTAMYFTADPFPS